MGRYLALWAGLAFLDAIICIPLIYANLPGSHLLLAGLILVASLIAKPYLKLYFPKPGSPYLALFIISWIYGYLQKLNWQDAFEHFGQVQPDFVIIYAGIRLSSSALTLATFGFLIIWFVNKSREKIVTLKPESSDSSREASKTDTDS